MKFFASVLLLALSAQPGLGDVCEVSHPLEIKGMMSELALSDGSVVGLARANVNIDGYGHAYHPENRAAGALIHLCNAGKVYLPDGTSYQGSESNATCTGKFMRDFARIGAAGWNDPRVGAIHWFGILGEGTATIAGRRVSNVSPVELGDGSGFLVSPTTLFDASIRDIKRQDRYVDPLKVRAAVIPDQDVLRKAGVTIGSFGVAYDTRTRRAVTFIVGDIGPRVGEATPKLLRDLAGLPHKDPISYDERYAGQIDEARIVWVFFGKAYGKGRYDAANPDATNMASDRAFRKWGGPERLVACVD